MRKRPVIVARPWETSLKLSRTLHWSALRSTWTARWGPADDLPLIGKDQRAWATRIRSAVCMSARGPNRLPLKVLARVAAAGRGPEYVAFAGALNVVSPRCANLGTIGG